MDTYSFGDYVVYETGYKSEVGRVTEDCGDSVFVCYHDGCTAASTPKEYLRMATDAEIAKSSPNLGYHRFDGNCPEYVPGICFPQCKGQS